MHITISSSNVGWAIITQPVEKNTEVLYLEIARSNGE